MQCQKKKRDGNRCKASALAGERHCALHSDPSTAAKLGSKGGRRRAACQPQELKVFEPPKTAADLRDLLAQSIVELRTGILDARIANSITYLGTGFLKAIDASDTEARLDALERNLQRLDAVQSSELEDYENAREPARTAVSHGSE